MGYHKYHVMVTQEKKGRDYTHYKRDLRGLDISDIHNKRNLATLLRKGGYLNANTSQGLQNQLNYAWGYLSSIHEIREIKIRHAPKIPTVAVTLPTPTVKKTEYYIRPKGTRKYQIRNKKTGRIIRWTDPYKVERKK